MRGNICERIHVLSFNNCRFKTNDDDDDDDLKYQTVVLTRSKTVSYYIQYNHNSVNHSRNIGHRKETVI